MSDSRFNTELDALVNGDPTSSTSELTEFAAKLYGEEQQVVMPNVLKRNLAAQLGLEPAGATPLSSAPISNRTARALGAERQSNRPWFIGIAIAAGLLLALTGILRFGLPGGDDNDNQFLLSSPAVPTVAATPLATPPDTEAWLAPVSAEECPQDELIDRGSWVSLQSSLAESYTPVPAEDQPYSSPNQANAEDVVTRQRQAMACINSSTDLAFPIESPRRAWMNSADAAENRDDQQIEWLQESKGVSDHAEGDLGLVPADLTYDSEAETGLVWDPAKAIQMADGRIALIPGRVVEPGVELSAFEGTAPVWVLVDDEWLLYDELAFCIGDCDSFWEQAGYTSPEATPAADPGTPRAISPEECQMADTGTTPVAASGDQEIEPIVDYVVVGPANEDDATAANETVRQFVACGFTDELATDNFALESTFLDGGFSPQQVALYKNLLSQGESVSGQMADLGVTRDDALLVPRNETNGMLFPNPGAAMEMEDGRILIPMGSFNYGDAVLGSGLILVNDGETWLVEDSIPLCFGDCESIYASYSQVGMDYIWLSPITAEECEGNAILPDGFTEEEIAVIRSRQYQACEMNGNGADLQGPDFAQTDANEELSGEIMSGLRQNGETAGSLQRIRMAAEDDDELTEGWNAFPPGTVVMLADGRVAVPEATVRANDMVGTSTGRTNPVITNVLIWTVDGDEWLLDEEATICLGNCDSYWNTTGTPEAVTSGSSAEALILPETCGEEFQVDFTSHAIMPITMRPGAGMASGTSVAQLPAGTELQYLCEFEETSNPSGDRMDEGQRWLKVRTTDGTEGWVREIDVVLVD